MIQDELGYTVAQLRHGYSQIVQEGGRAEGIARGIIGPQIQSLERLIARMDDRTRFDPEEPKPAAVFKVTHNDLVKLVRDQYPDYGHNRLSVAFRIDRITGGAQGGALVSVDVEAH